MASWAALNVAGGDARASAAHERATEEAQDADNAALYEQALRCQQKQQISEAKEIYQRLLRGPSVNPRLEYLCNKNLAVMQLEGRSFHEALEFFAAALALDATDVVVWCQMGATAVETGELWLARHALEEGLKVDKTYWPLVQMLAEVLNEIGDEHAYRRVADYIKAHDPHCASVRLLDKDKNRDLKLLKKAQKRLQHLHEITERGVKRREVLVDERRKELEGKMRPRRYPLVTPSWSALGKVLLEAFEENNRDEQADVIRTAVEIHVNYDEEQGMEVDAEVEVSVTEEEKTTDVSQDDGDHPPPAKRPKHKEVAKSFGALETSLSTGISDNDTQDSGIHASEVEELQPRRRKSRRNEERLREEHAAAIKKARENDLAYRLGAFLPEAIGKTTRDATPESVSIEWLPPLNVELVDAKFHLLTATNQLVLQTASFAFPSSAEGCTNSQSLQNLSRDQAAQGATQASSRGTCVSAKQISVFINEHGAGKTPCRGVMDWVRHYLNQCGQWSHLKLGKEDEDIHRVCTWLEKALKGELDASVAATPIQSSIVDVADHSLIQGSRFEGNGLTLSAQLFLLELHFDMLLQQPVRGKRRRTMKRQVENQLAQAQKLLFEFGWLEDSEEIVCYPTGHEFLRLLWLMARMYGRCGNPRMAQHYFIKCREKLIALGEVDHATADDNNFRVDLPNQKADCEITLDILDEKISGLRFSDVCSEARRLFEAADHDQVVSLLLGHFFPANQGPRMMDFLNEFEVDEDDTSARGDNSGKLFEMVMESLGQSSKYSDEDSALFLLTTLYYVIDFLDALVVKEEPNTSNDVPDEACTSALSALDYLLAQLTQNHCERVTNRDQRLLLCALCVKCLNPYILLRFDSPTDVLSMIRAALEVGKAAVLDDKDDSMPRTIGVDAMARLLYVIRSLSCDEYRDLFTLVPHSIKRKQPRRDRIRVVLVEIMRFLNRAFSDDDNLALSFPLPKRSALMTLCCTLMKEEEDLVARSDGKIPKQFFGNGAILFVLLYESFCRPDPSTLPSQLVALIHLLHERLGQHGICGLTYFSEAISSGDSRGSSCFLESCTLLLSKCVKEKTSVWDIEKSPPKSLDDSAENEESDDENGDEEEAQYRFQKEVCQCYRCLYDVQILPGCEDHKTGATFASLQSAEQSLKHEDAMRLTRFAVPILLVTKPKNNGQKKERLKLLYAVRNALSDSSFAALSNQPATVSPPLEAYLAPRGLLQQEVTPPLPLDFDNSATCSTDEACLGHLWYLLGANFILGRVKRRGNLGELMEMEQHVRERVEFLMKDVLYYHPDRIDSWVRLGKTMKELYHAATDAFAAILGRNFRIQAFRWYTTKILAQEPRHSAEEKTDGLPAPDMLSFQNVVLKWNLFKKIKEWQGKDADAHKTSSKPAAPKETPQQNSEEDQTSQIPIEEFATAYIVQVIEFARRCFEMAGQLAEEAAQKHEVKVQASTGGGADDEEVDFDEELDDLQTTIIECNEECGLLLYNVLQEFSLMKEVNLALFPRAVFSSLVGKSLAYFRKALAICETNEDANENHFRLQYMIGKTLKKRRWCELRQQELSDPEALVTATEMADRFSKAEAAREEGDREHALVHAFYSLQALRIDLTVSESPSVSALRLVCSHFYEEEEEEEEEEEDDEDKSVDSASTNSLDEKCSSQEKVAVSDTAPKDPDSASTAPSSHANHSGATKKDDIFALLSDAGNDDSIRELNVTLARGWLVLNIIEALESIPDEDRYFHPSRYVLARVVYWLSTFYSALEQSAFKDDNVNALLEAVRARYSEEKVASPSDAAARALKEMAPIFDKRRPQVVAIWFSEYIPTAKKFEELNQRQMKYDYYRLKYWRFFIALLQENLSYGRLKEVGSWVLACKEEHDVIDIMLGIVLHARGKVLRSRLQGVLDTMDAVAAGRIGANLMSALSQGQLPAEDRPVDTILKQLAKAYTYYLEVLNSQKRLKHIMDDSGLLLENAELPMVTVFFVGAVAYPLEMPLLEKDAGILDGEFNANIVVMKNALHRDELPPRIYDAQGREAWKAYLDAARSFCDEKWPERSGKVKTAKKHSRPKAAAPTVAAAPTTANSMDTTCSQPSAANLNM
ncbi:hypothetical protein KRP22_012897 [Phytophthora ramorum]|nr:Calcineurin-binding protein cabin-1 [Phytophthora ramorum]